MQDIATLGLAVDSRQVSTAAGELDKLTAAGGRAEDQANAFQRAQTNVSSALNQALGPLRQYQAILAGIGAVLATIKLTGLIGESVTLAARYETLGVVLAEIGTRVGYTKAQLDAYTESVRLSGITMSESRQTIIRMIQAQMDLGQASKLARLAQDAAVIGNTNSSDALNRLVYGIQSAQVEILRTIGLNVNFENSYRKMALELGKSVNALTNQEKTQARLNAALEAGKQIQGSYTSALETANKQLGSTTRYVEDLQVRLGTLFLPAYTAAVFGYSDALKFTSENFDEIIVVVGTLIAMIGGQLVARLGAATLAQNALTIAILRGTAVSVDGAAATRGRAAASLQAAQATAAETNATFLAAQANMEFTASELAVTRAEIALAQAQKAAQINNTGRLAIQREIMALRQVERVQIDTLAARTAALTAATTANAAAMTGAAAATAANNAALASTTLLARAATVAMNTLKAVMAFFGGPIGLAITAAAGAFYLLSTSQTQAQEASEAHARAMEGFNKVIDISTGKVRALKEEVTQLRMLQLNEAADMSRRAIAQEETFLRSGQSRIDRFAFDTGLPRDQAQALVAPIRDLNQQFLAGNFAAADMLEKIAAIGNQDKRVQGLAAEFANWMAPLLKATEELERTEAALKHLRGEELTETERALLGLGGALKAISDGTPTPLSDFEKMRAQLELTRDSIGKTEEAVLRLKLARDLNAQTGKSVFSAAEVDQLVAIQRQIDGLKFGEKLGDLDRQIAGQERLAVATLQGADAAQRAEIHNKALEETYLLGAGATAKLEDSMLRLLEAQRKVARAEWIDQTKQQIAANDNLARAYLDGSDAAIKAAERENEVASVMERLKLSYQDATKWVDALATSREQADNAKEVARIREETDAVYALVRERERLAKLNLSPDQQQQRTNAAVDRFVGGGARMGEIQAREAAERQMAHVKALAATGEISGARLNAAFEDTYDKMLAASDRWYDGAELALRDYAREAQNMAKSAYRFIGDVFRSLEDSIVKAVRTGKMEFSDLFDVVIDGLIRIFVQSQIIAPIANGLGMGGGGGGFTSMIGSFIGNLFHTGGIAGQGSGMTREVNPMIFMGAERFHGGGIPGLRTGEVPAILEWDEEVLTRQDPRHRWNARQAANSNASGEPIINIYDYRNDRESEPVQVESRSGGSGQPEIDLYIYDRVEKGFDAGRFDGSMKRNFNGGRAGIRRG